MDDYAGRVLADRYRLPLPPSDAYELVETRAFDTYSGQEVLLRQVPLPEVVDAEVLDADGMPSAARRATGRTVRRSTDPAVRRAIEAAQAAAQVPDHPRLDQVFDVFAEAGSLWIVSELVAARPLAALLAERPLNPYRAAEIGSDVLTALRVLHAHGWTHRNITVRTVLVCDDGRVVLTGLAAGAAEEALCGYMPVPQPDDEGDYGPPAVESGPTGPYEGFPVEEPPVQDFPDAGFPAEELPVGGSPVEGLPVGGLPVAGLPVEDGVPELPEFAERPVMLPELPEFAERPVMLPELPEFAERPVILPGPPEPAERPVPPGPPESSGHDGPDAPSSAGVPASRGHLEIEPSYQAPGARAGGPAPERQELVPRPAHPAVPLAESRAEPGAGSAAQLRAARAGAIAAYRAGARAAVRAGEDQQRRGGAVPAGPAVPGAGPGRGSASFDPGDGSGSGPAEGRSWDRAPGPAGGSGAGDGAGDGPGGTGPGGPRAGAGRGDGGAVPGARSGGDAMVPGPGPGDRTEQGGGSGYGGPAPGAEAGGAEGVGGIPGPAGPGAGSGGGPGAGGVGTGAAAPRGGRPVTRPPAGSGEARSGEARSGEARSGEARSREAGPREAGPGGPGGASPAPRADRAPDGPRTDGGSASGDGSAAQGQGVPARPPLTGAWGRPAAEPPFHGAFADDDLYDDDPFADDEDDEGPDGPLPPGRRVYLAGTWDDGPESGRPVPAGGSPGGFGRDELRADSRRGPDRRGPDRRGPDRGDGRGDGLGEKRGGGPGDERGGGRGDRLPQPVGARAGAGGWGEVVAGSGDTPAYRGPATPLAAERARQARIAVVGAVTERWAPEQAGPVHDNWQLAPPIGPSTDLWALGALLYRAVQGHAPYPEENAAELVQMVCGEPPAFAEECGPLRPVVESLLRQDPTERPDFEELRGWLRSLIRSAPEPEAGDDVVPLPPTDTARLPIVRRRGELVRRRWGRGAAHGRHRQGKRQRPAAAEQPRYEKPPRAPREPKGPKVLRTPPPARKPGGRAPRRLGRVLLLLILLLMAAAVAYAVKFMPDTDSDSGTGAATGAQGRPTASAAPAEPDPGKSPSGGAPSEASATSGGTGSQQPQTSRSAAALAPGYALRKDAEGFEVAVPKDFQRSPANADRQIRYGSDGFSVLIVPGRDTVKANGSDPLDYQRSKEPELKPFRESSWASSSGLRRVDVGQQVMAEGQFTWQEANGREVYVRNLVLIVSGRYHIVQVIGPESERDRVTDIYEQAVAAYRVSA